MKNKQLAERKHSLAAANRELASELAYLDRLLRRSGFNGGLAGVKQLAREMLASEKRALEEKEDPPQAA